MKIENKCMKNYCGNCVDCNKRIQHAYIVEFKILCKECAKRNCDIKEGKMNNGIINSNK